MYFITLINMTIPVYRDQTHSVAVASCHLCHVWAFNNEIFIFLCLQASNYCARLIFILAAELYDLVRQPLYPLFVIMFNTQRLCNRELRKTFTLASQIKWLSPLSVFTKQLRKNGNITISGRTSYVTHISLFYFFSLLPEE